MDKVQIKTMNLINGNILGTHFSDALELPFAEVVQTVQRNARQSYWEIMDTPDGVVKCDRNGYVTMTTVQLIRD